MKKKIMTAALIFAAFGTSFSLIQCGGADVMPGENLAGGEIQGSPQGNAEDLIPLIPKIKNDSITNANDDIVVDAGFAGNGTAIAIPSSYAASQCKFTASAANIEGRAISTSVSINTSTGEVVCEKVVQEREEVAPETRDCVASYTMICIR